MKSLFKRILPFLLVLALLTGCGAKSGSSRRSVEYEAEPAEASTMANGYSYKAARDEAADEELVVGAGEPQPVPGEKGTLPSGRKIIRNAELSIQTREYDVFMTDLESRVASAGGYIESSYTKGSSYNSRKNLRSASLTVRIPADNLDLFLDGVCENGNVLYKNIYTNDVTASYVDTEARLKALRTERDTLMGLLEKAEKMEDTIAIYERISNVTYEIESYESRLRTYDDQITYSTVTISIAEVERETVVVKETTGEEIARRFKENLQDVGDGLRSFGIWFVSTLPQILLTVIILLAVFLLLRLFIRKLLKKRRAKKQPPDQNGPKQEGKDQPAEKEPEKKKKNKK